MAKRFTDTDKYKKPFIRSLPGAYKLLWDYLYHECDHAGIWIVDFEIAQIYLGSDMPVDKDKALKLFNEDEVRVVEFSGGNKLIIASFIDFQYGELNPDNRVHNSVINRLKKENLYDQNKGLIRGLHDPKDKDKDKDMEKECSDIPKLSEVKDYFRENGYDTNVAEKAYNIYNASIEDHPKRKYWRDSRDNLIKNWKLKMQSVWFKDENKMKQQAEVFDGGTW